MGVYAGPDISESGLVLALDGGNIKSFKGEPTTNLARNSRDFSGTSYASEDEWVSSEPTRLTKTYISSIITPVGNGATLIQESGNTGYHHLSRYGGSSENGLHSLSCYLYPLTNDITDFCIGMLNDGSNNISFNLVTGAITYGGGISNRNAFITPVIGYPGWYRVGANIEGRFGGWVGCFGYSSYTSYTGTLGAKRCYITGIQYESKSSPTSFVEAQTTRGTTVATGGGWVDLSGNGRNGELVNGVSESSSSGGSLSFDGTNDNVRIPTINLSNGNLPWTATAWIKTTTNANTLGAGSVLSNANSGPVYSVMGVNSGKIVYWTYQNAAWSQKLGVGKTVNDGVWHFLSWVNYNNYTMGMYVDGLFDSNVANSTSGNNNPIDIIGGSWNSYFPGNIAQVSIYNRALSASEIQQNFNATRGRFGV